MLKWQEFKWWVLLCIFLGDLDSLNLHSLSSVVSIYHEGVKCSTDLSKLVGLFRCHVEMVCMSKRPWEQCHWGLKRRAGPAKLIKWKKGDETTVALTSLCRGFGWHALYRTCPVNVQGTRYITQEYCQNERLLTKAWDRIIRSRTSKWPPGMLEALLARRKN